MPAEIGLVRHYSYKVNKCIFGLRKENILGSGFVKSRDFVILAMAGCCV